MLIHNKKKRLILSVVNFFIELICLPRRLFSGKKSLADAAPANILLIRLDHIGDVVMTSPAFSLLRERFPESKIMLLTNSAGKELFSNDRRINEVIAFNWTWGKQGMKENFSISRIRELARLILRFRKEKIDLLIDFRGDLRFIILFGVLTGAKLRISNSRSGKSSLLHYTSDYDISRHEVERSMDVINCFVRSKGPVRPAIYLRDEEIRSIKRFVRNELQLPDFPERLAVIAPYSSNDLKSWPKEYFREVIRYLRSVDFTVVIVGTQEDDEDVQNIIRGLDPGVYSLAGKTSIRQLAALTAVSAIIVGVDTGVLHLASCFDTPIIAVFGPTRSAEFRPYSPYCTVIETNTCECNQFLHTKCDCAHEGYANCLFNLTPALIINALSVQIRRHAVANLNYE